MQIFNTLRKHKHNNIGFYILTVLVSIFILLNVIAISELQTTETMLFYTLSAIPIGALILILEKKKSSFASHFLLLAFFIGDSIRDLSSGFQYTGIFGFIIVLGAFASIYAILKLIAHKDEITKFVGMSNRYILSLIGISLLTVYFQLGFDKLLVYLILYLVIVLTSKQKETLLLVFVVYLNLLTNNFQKLLHLNVMTAGEQILIFLSIIICIGILFQTFKVYTKKNEPFIDNTNNYYS